MTDNNNQDTNERKETLALDKIEKAINLLQNHRPSESLDTNNPRKSHLRELEQQVIALLHDTVEVVEREGNHSAAFDLANAADTLLAAIQDLIGGDSQLENADAIGEVRKKTQAAKRLFTVIIEALA